MSDTERPKSSEYIELCNHVAYEHGGDPGYWTAKLPPELRLSALEAQHDRHHADMLKFTTIPNKHALTDLSWRRR